MSLPKLACLALVLTLSGCIEAGEPAGDEGGSKAAGAAGKKPIDPMDPFNATRIRSDTQKFDGSFLVGTQDPVTGTTDCGQLAREGIDQRTFDWTLAAKEADGNASAVRFVRLKLTGGSPGTLDIDILFLSPAGKQLAAGTSPEPNELVELVSPGLEAGVYKLRVIGCNLADVRFSLTAQADYHSV